VTTPSDGTPIAIVFPTESSTLGEPSKGALDSVAQRMAQDESLRLQLLAYAGGNDETASKARRLSLSRALSVRSYLIDRGVRSTRIDVRALGNRSEGGSPDRVDVIVVAR
jgi:outer membrane protein OmpA-like peptidoglycan-associated protein